MIKRVDNNPEESYRAMIDYKNLMPGSIVAIRVSLAPVAQAASQWADRALDGPVDVFTALRAWKNEFK